MSTPATGWRAERRLPSTRTAISKSSVGRTACARRNRHPQKPPPSPRPPSVQLEWKHRPPHLVLLPSGRRDAWKVLSPRGEGWVRGNLMPCEAETMRILVATDAWKPQVNGVVNTYVNLEREAASAGFELSFLTPAEFRTVPLPTYSEIRLALIRPAGARRRVELHQPDCIHIATE